MLAQPIKIDAECVFQQHQASTKAGARRGRLGIEEDVVELGKRGRRRRTSEGATANWNDALAEFCRLLDLPGAYLGYRRRWRQYEHDGVGAANKIAQPAFPRLCCRNAFKVNAGIKSGDLECEAGPQIRDRLVNTR